MDHQFVAAKGNTMQGVWFEDNGSIVCRWWWDPASAQLSVRSGPLSQSEPISVSPEVAADQAALEHQLKSAALALAQRMV